MKQASKADKYLTFTSFPKITYNNKTTDTINFYKFECV